MKKLAVITARGGSKRILRKNIKLFLGRPIIQYSIEAALESNCFDEVMVSTDDEEIAAIAIQCGAKVPFYRSKEAADDFATTADVIIEVLEMYQLQGKYYDQICCIYPTAPFVTGDKLNQAMSLLEREKADSVLPVVAFSFPPQRCVLIQDKKIRPKCPENMKLRSQDLETYYHDCGQFYCLQVKAFLKSNQLITDNTLPFIMSELEVQDIDTEDDWKIAEVKYKLIKNSFIRDSLE